MNKYSFLVVVCCLNITTRCHTLQLAEDGYSQYPDEPTCALAEEDESAILVASLKDHFASGCVFILFSYHPDITNEKELIQIQKKLARLSIASAAVSLMHLMQNTSDLWCSYNMPFYVVHNGNWQTAAILKEQDSLRQLVSAFMLVLLEENMPDDLQLFNGTPLPLDTEFLVARRAGVHSWCLAELWTVGPHLPLQRAVYACWECGAIDRPWPSLELWHRRSDLRKLPLTVVTPQMDGYQLTVNEDGLINDLFPAGELWNFIAKRLNLSTQLIVKKDASCGSYDHGQWSGMVGDVHEGKAHVGLSLFTMSAARTSVVSFTTPIFLGRYYIFIRSDGVTHLGPNPLQLLVPLKHDVWLAVMFTIIAYTMTMAGIFYIQVKPLCDAVFSVIGAFVQKSDVAASYYHRTASEQCLQFAAFITGSVLLSAYSAGIISILTVTEQKLPFHNFAEIEQDGSYTLSVTDNSFEYDFFKLSQQKLLQKLFSHQMDIYNLPRTKPEGLSRVCTENKYAFLSTDLSIQSSWNHQNCNVVAIPIDMFRCTLALILRKNSPYIGGMNFHIQILRAAGLLNHMLIFYNIRDSSSQQLFVENNVMEIQNIGPIICVLVIGIICSFVCLIMETVMKRLCLLYR